MDIHDIKCGIGEWEKQHTIYIYMIYIYDNIRNASGIGNLRTAGPCSAGAIEDLLIQMSP